MIELGKVLAPSLAMPLELPDVPSRNVCVVVADATRARVLVLDIDRHGVDPDAAELVELTEITNPILRVRNGPDHLDRHHHDVTRHFAAQIAEEAAAAYDLYPSRELVLAASPAMLGVLRTEVARRIGPTARIAVHELARDLVKLPAGKLRDRLTEAGLLPGRAGPLTAPPRSSVPVRRDL